MEIKGSAVKTIPEFIQKQFPDKYAEWLKLLPPASAGIFNATIQASDWYPLNDAAVVPTEVLSKVAYGGDLKKASWECGKFSAESTLKGLYKFFLMAVPSKMVVSSGARILSTFYQPVQVSISGTDTNKSLVHITRFNEPSLVVENRIAGWIEKALEIQKVTAVKVEITKSMSQGDPVTEISIIWS